MHLRNALLAISLDNDKCEKVDHPAGKCSNESIYAVEVLGLRNASVYPGIVSMG